MGTTQKIEPLYKKYDSRTMAAFRDTEFYSFFLDTLSCGKNVFQFSNRKVEKSVDERWVNAIEAAVKPIQEVIANPRNFIQQDEIIVNVALSKKVTPDSIRHLAQHGNMIDEVTETNVRPNKLMQKTKEDSWNTYENKFVYTLIEMTWDFLDKRYEAIFSALNEEYGAHLLMQTDSHSFLEHITCSIDLRIQQDEDLLSADSRNETIFSRIARLHRLFGNFRTTLFVKTMAKFGKIKPPLVRTNAIAKNPNFKACHKLWDFILTYTDVGYKIEIYEQSPEIDEQFTRDIYHAIMIDYVILKYRLEMEEDRRVDTRENARKKQLKPKYIKQIVEEITRNYDLPDVEIRKVLVEEITKAQLMQEEEKERLRLVREKEKETRQREKEEKAAKEKAEKEAEKERLRKVREAEKQKVLEEQERLQEKARKEKEIEKAKQQERALVVLFRTELQKIKDDRPVIRERIRKAQLERERTSILEELREINEMPPEMMPTDEADIQELEERKNTLAARYEEITGKRPPVRGIKKKAVEEVKEETPAEAEMPEEMTEGAEASAEKPAEKAAPKKAAPKKSSSKKTASGKKTEGEKSGSTKSGSGKKKAAGTDAKTSRSTAKKQALGLLEQAEEADRKRREEEQRKLEEAKKLEQNDSVIPTTEVIVDVTKGRDDDAELDPEFKPVRGLYRKNRLEVAQEAAKKNHDIHDSMVEFGVLTDADGGTSQEEAIKPPTAEEDSENAAKKPEMIDASELSKLENADAEPVILNLSDAKAPEGADANWEEADAVWAAAQKEMEKQNEKTEKEAPKKRFGLFHELFKK